LNPIEFQSRKNLSGIRSRRLRRISLGVVSVCFALLLAEVALRVMGISYPVFRIRDDIRGVALHPGAEGWYRAEGRGFVRINSDGLRDREHGLNKPGDVFRIAVLGDSMAEGNQVPVEQTFWRLLERTISGCPALRGRKPEVINFSAAGYGTAQELLTLRLHAWKYQPDIVLLAVFLGNDISDNYPPVNSQNPDGSERPVFVYQGDHLVLRPPAQESAAQRRLREALVATANHSYLLQFVRELRQRGASGHLFHTNPNAVGVDQAIFKPPATPTWNEGWRVTEGLLSMMQDEVRGHGASLVMVPVPTPVEADPDPAVRQRFMRQVGVDNLSYPYQRLTLLGRQLGVPVISLQEEFLSWAEAHHQYLYGFSNSVPGFGHMNEDGHRLAAEIIGTRLCSDGSWMRNSTPANDKLVRNSFPAGSDSRGSNRKTSASAAASRRVYEGERSAWVSNE